MNPSMRTREDGDTTVCIGRCRVTGKPQRIEVHTVDFERFAAGEFAQRCFPYLSAGDREFLMSGMSNEGFDQFCGVKP